MLPVMGLFKKKKIGRTLNTKGRYRPSVQSAKAISRRRKTKKFEKLKQNAEKKLLKTRRDQKRFKKIIRPTALIVIGAILYSIGHLLFISDIFIIKKIQFDPNAITVEDENPILNYLKNFEGENILLLDEFTEESYLYIAYPEYKTINIKKSLPSTLVLELEIYENSANVISNKDGYYRKFIINENGTAVETDTEDPSLPYIYLETDEIILEDQTIIAPEVLEFIIEANTDFENKFGMQILDTTYYKTAREVHLRTEQYFYVWLDTQLTVDEQLTKLKQALPSLNIYEEDLQYIDLRISGQSGDKVIYMLN